MVYNTRSYTRNQRITMLNKLNEELRSNSYDIKNNIKGAVLNLQGCKCFYLFTSIIFPFFIRFP